MWWMRLCLYRRLELMARLSLRSSKDRSSRWGSSLGGVSSMQGCGLVDLRGLYTWFGGVVENSTGGVASLPNKYIFNITWQLYKSNNKLFTWGCGWQQRGGTAGVWKQGGRGLVDFLQFFLRRMAAPVNIGWRCGHYKSRCGLCFGDTGRRDF